jgi:hypothetical protein
MKWFSRRPPVPEPPPARRRHPDTIHQLMNGLSDEDLAFLGGGL